MKKNDVNNSIYFLDNTQKNYNNDKGYFENGKYDKHNYDNLRDLNELNTKLIIDGQKVSFKKYFNPKEAGIYYIKLIMKYKFSDWSYRFCGCKNITKFIFI